MHSSSYFVLYAKISSFPDEKQQSLLRLLSDSHIDGIRKNHAKSVSFSLKDFILKRLLNSIHYSWFLPTLQLYPENHLFLPLFSKKQGEKLAKALKMPFRKISLPKPLLTHLELVLEDAIFEDKYLLPKEYLSSSELEPLLHFDKKELVDLIDALSLYDLSLSLRQIVDQNILKEISDHLSEKEKKAVASFSSKQDGSLFPKILYKNPQQFKQELHKRGIYRLGIALQTQKEDFVWYISHTLDIGRGKLLLQAFHKKALANVAQDMVKSVLNVVEEPRS